MIRMADQEANMVQALKTPGTTRKLYVTEYNKYRDHLLRLDHDSRRMRFGMAVDDDFIKNYALRLHDMKSIVYGHMIDGEVRANESEIDSVRFISRSELNKEFQEQPQQFTPWFVEEWTSLQDDYAARLARYAI